MKPGNKTRSTSQCFLMENYIICLVTPVMGELAVLSFQASSMHEELAKNPEGDEFKDK